MCYELKVYRQECLECEKFVVAVMYPDEQDRLAEIFSKRVINFIDGVDFDEDEERDQRRSRMRAPHQTDLCEACRLKVCKYKPSKRHRY